MSVQILEEKPVRIIREISETIHKEVIRSFSSTIQKGNAYLNSGVIPVRLLEKSWEIKPEHS